MPAFVDTMAYREAGGMPWHGLGFAANDEELDRHSMIQNAGLKWEATKVPATFMNPVTGNVEEIPDAFTVVRSDSGKSVVRGTAVGKGYTPFQNTSLFDLFDEIKNEGGSDVRYETAGSLHDGAVVWALAQIAGQFEVARQDGSTQKHGLYLLGYNSHDGRSKLRVRFTDTRVVCANTARVALYEDKPEWSGRHSANLEYRAREAGQVLGLVASRFGDEMELLNEFAKARMSEREFKEFACQIITGEDEVEKALAVVAESEGRQRTIFNRRGGELTNLFNNGKGNLGNDAYDAEQSIRDWVDHQRKRVRNWDDRVKQFEGAQFGSGMVVKDRARKLLRTRLKV